MGGNEYVLDTYSLIVAKSGEMLDAAKNGDRDRLFGLEQDCRALTEKLKQIDNGTIHPDSVYLQRKAELIRKVLSDDAEIRKFTEHWMTPLASYLDNGWHKYRLQQASESNNGS